jgi:hypothetical protein
MIVRIVQIDGALPNIALMKLAHWHRAQGDTVYLTRQIHPTLFEPTPDRVYASAIFEFSADRLRLFSHEYPDAIIGGSATSDPLTVEQALGVSRYEHYDYSDFPEFDASIGYTQRGCRMSGPKSPCRKFCIVPDKEGFPKAENTIAELWRGAPWPKKIHLLDNDFFGGPQWRERIQEIRDGGYRVCFSQGINTRLINTEAAEALASVQYRNTKFNERKLYTAWDNIGDESVFFRGVDTLERAGVPSKHLMAYMLIGCDPAETWGRIWHRFNRMVERGIEPYPMVYQKARARKDLVCFQRWVITGLYRIVPWGEYERETKSAESFAAWQTEQVANPPSELIQIGQTV